LTIFKVETAKDKAYERSTWLKNVEVWIDTQITLCMKQRLPCLAWNMVSVQVEIQQNPMFCNLKTSISRIIVHTVFRSEYPVVRLFDILKKLPLVTFLKTSTIIWL